MARIVPPDNVRLAKAAWKLTGDEIAVPHLFLVRSGVRNLAESLKAVGGEFSIFMPLQIGAATKNYTFAFKVIGVE